MIASVSYYILFLTESSRQLIDVWPLEGVFWETTITILAVTMLSYMLFRSWASVIFSSSIQAFLVVLLPVLKYPNALNIIGPWDSAAHYSFAKWIIEKGYVDTAGNLYYSSSYSFHPGNGILPAVLSMASSIGLGWSMNVLSITAYICYILFILATLERLGLLKRGKAGVGDAFWLTAIIAISVQLSDYFHPGGLGYAYVGLILYDFLRRSIKKDYRLAGTMSILMGFLASLVTHLSTTVIVVVYLLFITTTQLAMRLLRRDLGAQEVSRKEVTLIILLLTVFLAYEIYVDVMLFGSIIKSAFDTIYSLYVRELVIASKIVEARGLSLSDLVLYLISSYTKTILVLGVALVHTIALVCKRKALNDDERTLALLLVTSYPTWAIGWAGVGSFLSGGRALAVISFLLSLSVAATYKKLYDFATKKRLALAIPVVLIVLGFSLNFGLPFEPMIKSDGEAYTYPTYYQGGFGDYALRPITYASLHMRDVLFLCLQPYTAFGLADLIWNSPKIPKHGFVAPETTTPESMIKLMENYLGRGIVIPQPMRDRLLPGPIGYRSLYEKPSYFLLENGRALIYSNGAYALFLA
jgi:hypothetical protein